MGVPAALPAGEKPATCQHKKAIDHEQPLQTENCCETQLLSQGRQDIAHSDILFSGRSVVDITFGVSPMRRILLMAGFFSFIAGLFSASARAADYNVAEIYSGLRTMVFSTTPDDVGVKLKEANEVCR